MMMTTTNVRANKPVNCI